jgi:plastocyanin
MRAGCAGLSVLSAALLGLTACSNDANLASPAPTTGGPITTLATDEPTSAPPDDRGTRIAVSEDEYSITLPRTDFTPGTYIFVVDNYGPGGHDLTITGPGVDIAKRMPRGSQAEVVVTLQPGIYELWCSIGNHRARGMQHTVTVAG